MGIDYVFGIFAGYVALCIAVIKLYLDRARLIKELKQARTKVLYKRAAKNALIERLRPYLQHIRSCPSNSWGIEGRCECGLKALQEQADD